MRFDVEARSAARPAIVYDEALPVTLRREEIAATIAQHQVVVICGETGSGKTTQLPKICLEIGRGLNGLIGHTQPRRIAARATATRIAQELKSELGRYVGFKIRFTDRVSPETYIKLMTDGILLAETQTDPLLRQYDTLIIDEAHERSLNIDFMLGYLKQLLPKRPDLKVIVTSATLDAERFSQHFSINKKAAPVIEVSGRLYPIETRYRPWAETPAPNSPSGAKGMADRDINEAIVDAVSEAHRAGSGDVLVFLPGEREIREAAEALRKHSFSGGAAGLGASLEILPLFARQSAPEQARVFSSHQGRRVVLATNVAETSLTVPGIRYVIDTGLARVKRYSYRNKIEQLQVEPIARAAANQRAGRCGRVSAGICFRLYAEDDFNKRAAYTESEILRSSLAGVILRMKSLHLGDVENFPFIEPPAPRMIADGYQLLAELGAVTTPPPDLPRLAGEVTSHPLPRGEGGVSRSIAPRCRSRLAVQSQPWNGGAGRWCLTSTGVELARLPLDPKIGRMILAARDYGCLSEMLIIAAALSVQDPRERPQEQAGSADQAHAKWKDEKSEFLSYLKLWHAADSIWKHETSNKQRQWCRQNFLSWLRVREWRDVHAQLLTLCHEHGWKISSAYPVAATPSRKVATAQEVLSPSLDGAGDTAQSSSPPVLQRPDSVAAYAAIHKALLTGLLGHIGLKSEEEAYYLGARGIKFFIHPGSSLIKKAGRWIVAAELVETSRLFARCVARIEPEWLEQVGGHLLRSHIYDPHWEKGPGQVVAWERVTLHGLLLHAKRRVHYGPLDEKLSREILIRSALVEGEVGEDWVKKWRFFQHNAKLMREIEALEHKSRRPDVLVDDELIYAFYDATVAAGITTLAAFDRWRREAEVVNPKLLFLEKAQLMRHEAAGITTAAFPPYLEQHGQKFTLHYHHHPGAPDDGVTLDLPLVALNQLSAQRCEWLVPGLLKEKVIALLKTLPQKYRHRLQPLDAFADDFCTSAMPADEPLMRTLTQAVEEKLAMKLPLDAFRLGELRPHLFMNFRLLSEHGGTLAISRHLTELRTEYRERVAQIWQNGVAGVVAAVKVAAVANMDDTSIEAASSDMDVPPVAQPVDDTVLYVDWLFGPLPELLEINVKDRQVIGFPALVDEGDGVRLTVFDTQAQALAEHRRGLMRLFSLQLATQVKAIEKLFCLREMALQFIPLGTEKELKTQLVAATLERTCLMAPLPLEKSAFVTRCDAARGRILLVAQEIAWLIAAVIGEYAALQKKIVAAQKTFAATCVDINAQLAALLHKNFIVGVPYERLQHYPRYLKAATLRLDKARSDPTREARLLAEWQALGKPWERERHALQKSGQTGYHKDHLDDPFMEEFRWLLEELRVALFAQELRTPTPVSIKRLQKMWDARMR